MSKRQACGGCVLLPLAVALLVFLFIEVHPSHVPKAKSPSWLDEIFANGVLLAFVRLILIVGVLYAIVSIVGLISEGRWLSEVGPAKASKAKRPIAVLDSNVRKYEHELRDARDTITQLERQLDGNQTAFAKAQQDLGVLLAYVDTLKREKGKD